MTVIAVRDGLMAADSLAVIGDDETKYRCDKLFRIKGCLVGVAGDTGPCWALIDFLKKGGRYKGDTNFSAAQALVLHPKNGILLFDETGWPDPVHEPYYAIGSGSGIALGAMHQGATAAQAVAAAIHHCAKCGPPVVTMRL